MHEVSIILEVMYHFSFLEGVDVVEQDDSLNTFLSSMGVTAPRLR